ncbi:MAG: hypothetical protein LBI56_02935 [Puniceicoccales bacterium]|nr:hypothetical protein [Puniceicoccales bacterium]
MNKVFEILQGGISQDATKTELKQLLQKGIGKIDEALRLLRSPDADKFILSMSERIRSSAKKGYEEGRLSEENVENARKNALIFPSAFADKIYELNKMIYEFGKQMHEQGESPTMPNDPSK